MKCPLALLMTNRSWQWFPLCWTEATMFIKFMNRFNLLLNPTQIELMCVHETMNLIWGMLRTKKCLGRAFICLWATLGVHMTSCDCKSSNSLTLIKWWKCHRSLSKISKNRHKETAQFCYGLGKSQWDGKYSNIRSYIIINIIIVKLNKHYSKKI